MSKSPLHVIVLDDRSRFALHAWRYLSRSVGFGIGEVPSDGKARFRPGENTNLPEIQRPWRLSTPAGDAVIWWVYVRKEPENPEPWVKELEKVLGEAKEKERRVFLVDARGEPTRVGKEEFWREALPIVAKLCACPDLLPGRDPDPDPEDIWLVSSYGMGIRRFETASKRSLLFNIRPKSSETLQELANKIWPPRVAKHPPSRETAKIFHFLVSGAGFELKSRMTPPINSLGVPSTPELLMQAYRDKIWHARPGATANVGVTTSLLPLPLPPIVETVPAYRNNVSGAAHEGSLDRLWDELLEVVLGEASFWNLQCPPNVRKAAMLDADQSARESFRASFMGDDWGQLTQTLDAVALPLDAWLTTNYTHFVDRAVALQRHFLGEEMTPALPWRIVSIASEAENLLRRIFFDERSTGEESSPERFIFKLHGDLAHLSTMAVAGQDKEIFGLMTRTVEDLHWLYEAAQNWLERLLRIEVERLKRLRVEGNVQVFWHIVGHGLKDQALVRTIERVVSSTPEPGVKHSFLFIQPSAEDVFRRDVKPTAHHPDQWHPQPYGADQWLAMLRKFNRIHQRMWTLDEGDLQEAVLDSIRSAKE